jgi:hypothetical protein
MPKYCEKFILTEEDDGDHFLSGIDGSLYLPKVSKFIPNEQYCVDYFYDKQDFDPSVDVIKVSKCKA